MAANVESRPIEISSDQLKTNQNNYKREKMVGWYDPIQLLKTANEVLISTILGKHADRRMVEALSKDNLKVYDYHGNSTSIETASKGVMEVEEVDPEEFWFDYVSDIGDGWNSTYAVAYYLSQEKLKPEGASTALPRGQILIMGGDEVYPTADNVQYRNRLEHPYSIALQNHDGPNPLLFAIPGNHDWYDSLSSFTQIFFDKYYFPLFDEDEPKNNILDGLWKIPQHRSYFAVKLPRNYWVIGVDLQLSSDLDTEQLEYFKAVALEKMSPGDQIILCSPEPFWIYSEIYSGIDSSYKETRLGRSYLEEKIFTNQKIVAYLAGDLHHYYRLYDQTNKIVKITAGGGGAFLHPTHGPLKDAFEGACVDHRGNRVTYSKCSFPDAKKSAQLGLGNLLFLFKNWKFGVLTALVYFLSSWSILAFLPVEKHLPINNYWDALYVTFRGGLETPVAVLWGLAIILGFWLFTDTHSKAYRFIGGLTHGAVHLICIFLIGWGAFFLTVDPYAHGFKEPVPWFISTAIIFLSGWIFASIIFGLYLLISLNIFKRHSNEAFSSLANQDWKNFLRMKIDKNGLTIYPIGIRRVPRKWREATSSDHTVSGLVPDDNNSATLPILIENEITLPR